MLGRKQPFDNFEGVRAELSMFSRNKDTCGGTVNMGEGRMTWEKKAEAGHCRL